MVKIQNLIYFMLKSSARITLNKRDKQYTSNDCDAGHNTKSCGPHILHPCYS